jgi:hypothetical protein
MVYGPLDDSIWDSPEPFLTDMNSRVPSPCLMGGKKICFLPCLKSYTISLAYFLHLEPCKERVHLPFLYRPFSLTPVATFPV